MPAPSSCAAQPVDGRSDIYSTGVILYEMLTGFRPFDGPATKLISDHLSTPPPPFSAKVPEMKIAPEIERVVMRCLSKTPAERPQSCAELYEEFVEANLQSQGASSVFPTTSTWPQPPCRSQPAGEACRHCWASPWGPWGWSRRWPWRWPWSCR